MPIKPAQNNHGIKHATTRRRHRVPSQAQLGVSIAEVENRPVYAAATFIFPSLALGLVYVPPMTIVLNPIFIGVIIHV